jgi:hydroxymethylglutaryl-CoA lyase
MRNSSLEITHFTIKFYNHTFATLQVFLSLKIYGANKIIECPRDAMQGIKPFIPTERKLHTFNLY